jgi:hypothetical protein
MRKVLSAFVAAIFVAGVFGILTAAPVAAANVKPCWSHYDDDPLSESFGEQVAVWAMGGGHDKHQEAGLDFPLGEFETRAECEAAFAALSAE